MISRRETIAPVIPVDAVKDTIVLVLQALQDSVTSNRQGIYDHAWQEGLRLSYSNELVNTKIYRLIMDFEAEDTAYLMQRIERNEAFRRRSSRILGGVAIGAVVLMLLLPPRAGARQPRQGVAAGGAREADAGHHARHQGPAGIGDGLY